MGASYRTAAKLARLDLAEIRAREARDPIMQALSATLERIEREHPIPTCTEYPECTACQEYVAVRRAAVHRKRELREGRLG